ncbi:energy-coupling factor transporter ATPase [Bifidobacterium amazonense]|uniref:Energy-coupling factor transporter ATPase n=1 Tax=Bifidobacterium amazonense TaxID=2809027 RepID=A0ABS9VSW2_9BIFI|nr:energy-coupling factor transporter ATPase [Bifidobacterium amazonense]MCH9275075.1 energy-coupling factor transporter ATPase [Bifidobacterium amazonense]
MNTTATAAELAGIRFSYDGGTSWALDGVSLTVRAGEYVCLTGANGSGKSTLARLIAGLTAPDAGDVTLLGHRVFASSDADGTAGTATGANPAEYRAARRGIGAVFQNPEDQIVTTITEDDVAFGPENLGLARETIGERIVGSLDAVDMAAHRRDDPTRMSGGQQQRVAIAGMLAMNPAMLVLDEPTAMLDPAARADVLRILDELHARGTTIVHVTHHADEAARAGRVVRLERGRIVGDRRNAADGSVLGTPQPIVPAQQSAQSSSAESAEAQPSPVRSSTAQSSPAERRPATSVSRPGDGDQTNVSTTAAHRPLPSPTATSAAASTTASAASSAASSAPAIAVSHVSYRYPGADRPAISDLSLTVGAGETVAIMGENGAGKSTLARLLCALDKPSAGSISIAGVPVAVDRAIGDTIGDLGTVDSGLTPGLTPDYPPKSEHGSGERRHRKSRVRTLNRRQRERLRGVVGFVMQHPERQLFADTVADDVAYGPRNQRLTEPEVAKRVTDALHLLHIDHLAERSPFSLSGGQQRLVAIAGVIACRPRVLVMDEPTASLDADATARIHELIRTLNAQGVTVLIITHSFAEARAVADRTVTLGGGSVSADATVTTAATATVTTATASASAMDSAMTSAARTDHAGHTDHDDYAVRTNRADRTNHTDRTNRTNHVNRTNHTDAVSAPGSGADTARDERSLIARLDPRVKMVAFLAMMFTAFAINTPLQLALGAVVVATIVAMSGVGPLRLLRSVHMFLAMFVVMGLLNVFFVRSGNALAQLGPIPITDDGVTIAILYALRLALVIILGAILLETTTPTELTDGFGSLLSPLNRFGLHTQELALVMSLALRFLPTLGAEAKAVADAQAARGGTIETGPLPARLRAMTALCVPMFAGAIRHADNLSLALDARCYEEGIRRTHWRALRVRGRDRAFCAAVLLYIAVLVVLGMLA